MKSQTTDACDRRHRPPPRRRPRRAILLLAALSALAGPAAAEQRPREPRFYLERIAVEGVRHASPEVIVSESLLAEGTAHTEAELRQAVYRVQRLPFVLGAAFSLGRGSERGRYTLLITVEEVRRFFFGSDLVYAERNDALQAAFPESDGMNEALSAGMRTFVGQGVLFAAAGDGEGLQVGYERYRLRGRPVLLRFAYAREGCCPAALQEIGLDPGAAVWTAVDEADRLEMTFGVPLAGNHSLRLDASHLEVGSAARRPLGGAGDAPLDARDVEQQELELAWIYDSTDDPVFPSRGDAFSAAVGLRWLEGDLSAPQAVESVPGAATASEMSSRLIGLSFLGARHWPLSDRQTVSLSLKLLASRSEVDGLPLAPAAGEGSVPSPEAGGGSAQPALWSGDVDTLEAGLGARYSLSLWGPGKIRRRGELRWETLAKLIYLESSPVLSPIAHPLWGLSLSTGIALRNTWGIFRIGFTYLDYDGVI